MNAIKRVLLRRWGFVELVAQKDGLYTTQKLRGGVRKMTSLFAVGASRTGDTPAPGTRVWIKVEGWE